MDHLEPSQFLDLEQPRQLGPLFDQAKLHLNECAACRKTWLEFQALKALALEASIEADSRLIRKALQNARKLEVEERLSAEAGPDAAREILLQKRGASGKPAAAPLLVALLALCVLAGVFFYSRRDAGVEIPSAPKALPFEFQESPPVAVAGLSPSATVEATPALGADERAEDQELDNEARRMLVAHLNKEGRSEATSTPIPTARPTRIPTRIPTQIPTAHPTPIPAVPTQAPADESEVSFNASTPTALPLATASPDPPQAALVIQNQKFSEAKAESAALQLYLPEAGAVEIRVFDTAGKSVKLICDGSYGPGQVSFKFRGKSEDGQGLAPGTYYARVMTRWFSRVEALEVIP